LTKGCVKKLSLKRFIYNIAIHQADVFKYLSATDDNTSSGVHDPGTVL